MCVRIVLYTVEGIKKEAASWEPSLNRAGKYGSKAILDAAAEPGVTLVLYYFWFVEQTTDMMPDNDFWIVLISIFLCIYISLYIQGPY